MATEEELKHALGDITEFLISGEHSDKAGSVTYLDSVQFICFAAGTKITTSEGQKTVETLRKGDLVLTRDNALQPIRWIGSRKINDLNACDTANNEELEKFKPVLIKANTFGKGRPSTDLRVSRQHRILVCSKIAERMFNTPEVLVPAIKLIDLPGVSIDHECSQIE